MKSYYTLLATNYKTKHQTLVGYFNFSSTKPFRSTQKSKIINNNKLTKNMILTLHNELSSTSDKENE